MAEAQVTNVHATATGALDGGKGYADQAVTVHGEAVAMADTAKSFVAPVIGSILEKVLYYVVLLVAFAMFAWSCYGIFKTAKDEIITSVNIDNKDEIVFPAMWMCIQNKVERAGKVKLKEDPAATPKYHGMKLLTPKKGEASKGLCPPDFTCEFPKFNDTATPFLEKVQAKVVEFCTALSSKACTGEDDFHCQVLNGAGTVKDSRTAPKLLWIEGGEPPTVGFVGDDSPWLLIGLADPAQTQAADPGEVNVEQWMMLNAENFGSIVTYTVDYLVDRTSKLDINPVTTLENKELIGGTLLKEDDLSVQHIYLPQVARRQKETDTFKWIGNMPVRNNNGWEVFFRTGSFTVREIVKRKKAVFEIWNEIGGAFGTSVLLVSLFFTSTVFQRGQSPANGWISTLRCNKAAAVQEYEMKCKSRR